MTEVELVDPVLDALWERARADFSVDEPNRAFIEHCRQARMLSIAASRYRAARASAEAPAAEAISRRLEAVTVAALADLDLRRGERTVPTRPWWLYVLAALVLLVALYGLAAAFAS